VNRDPLLIGFAKNSGSAIYTRNEVPGILTLGGPGSGKSSQLITALLTYRKSVAVFSDVNGELAAVTARLRQSYGAVYQINPFNMFGNTYLKDIPKIGFNPMRLLDPRSPKFSVQAAKLAAACIPKNDNAREPYWDNTSFALTHSTIMAEVLRGETPYLSHVAEKIYGNVFEYAADVVAHARVSEVRLNMQRYCEAKADDVKSLREVIENTRSHLKFLLDESIGKCLSKDDGFSFTRMNREVITLYVILPLDVVGALGTFFKLILASALTELFDQEEV
jgi:type IV secretion system protein VirD4